MADLSTTYMGIPLGSPVVVGACTLSGKLDRIKAVEEAGAGALVIKSLFEEQIEHELKEFDDALDEGAEMFAEAVTYLPRLQHAGAKEHLMWIEKARAAVEMPLIGSINAVRPGKWAEYTKQVAETGVNGIELNVYAVEADIRKTAQDVEAQMLDTFEGVRACTDLPIAVKISPFYTSLGNIVTGLEARGANAVVLFNRFLQPDVDADAQEIRTRVTLSERGEVRLPMRWIALLYERTKLDLIGSTGIHETEDVVKCLLAGAQAVQMVSGVYRYGTERIPEIAAGLSEWMNAKGYETLADFRGKVSQAEFDGDAYVFERAQYLDFVLDRNP